MDTRTSAHLTPAHVWVKLFGLLTLGCGENAVLLPILSDRRLLAYLLVHYQQMHSRVALAGQLRPDMSESRARRALSQSIWRIKQCLPGLLESDSSSVGISPRVPIWIDIYEFEALLKSHLAKVDVTGLAQTRADLHQAIQLYRGDLLEGFYDDWVLAARDRLRGKYLCALDDVINLEKQAGNYGQALAAAQTLAAAEPLRESAHREIMRLERLLGRPDAALRQFATCCQTLDAELDTQPEIETIQLAQEIAHDAGQKITPYLPAQSQPGAPIDNALSNPLPLVGRKSERSSLIALVEAACKGMLGFVLLEGEAGVGKTRLLQEIARDAEWRGAQVLWGKGKELEATSPYEPLLEALRSGLSPLRLSQIAGLLTNTPQSAGEQPGSRLGPIDDKVKPQANSMIWLQVLSPLIPAIAAQLAGGQAFQPAPLDPIQEHMRLVGAFSHLLMAWARVTSLVLILEDMHWVDRDTLDTLIDLAQQLPAWSGCNTAARPGTPDPDHSSGGLLIIGSYRGEEARSQPEIWERLQRLDRLGLHGRLVLSPLDAATTGELVRCSLGTSQSAPLFENRLFGETGGNALFVLETLRYLYGEGLLGRDESGEWATPFDENTTDYAELPLSPAVERIIARRLDRLPSDHRLVMSAGAVLGNRFDFSMITALTELEVAVAVATLSELVQRGFVTETAQEYCFQHDKVRLVAYESLDPQIRQDLHRRAAQIVEASHPDWVETLAYHAIHGQVWDKAISYHQRSAEKAQNAYAYAAAVEHLNQALQLLDQVTMEDKRYDLLAAREVALDILGNREAQAADLKAMLQLAADNPQRRIHVQCRRTDLLVNLSQYDEAETAAREALATATSSGDRSAQAAALLALGRATGQGQPKQVLSCLRQAVEISQSEKDLPQEAAARHMLAITLHYYDQPTEAWDEARLALSLYQELRDRRGEAKTLGTLGNIRMVQGENDASIPYYLDSLQIAREIGDRHEEARVLGNLGNVFLVKGQCAQALQHYDESYRIFRILGNPRAAALSLMNSAYLRHHLLGDNDTARADLETGLVAYKAGDSTRYEFLATLGDVARCQGDYQAARVHLESAVAGAISDADYPGAAVPAYYYLILLDLDEGNPASALKHLEAAEDLCQEDGPVDWAVKLPSLRGLVLLALNQPKAALAATSEAMRRLKPGVEQAYLIPFRHFRALSALGRTPEAHAALDQSYQMLAEILNSLPPDQQKMSRECVPEHQTILASWQAIHPPRITMRLPRADVPTGRPLRDDEWVDVQWTVTEARDDELHNKVTRRHIRLLRLLREAEEQNAMPTLDDLASALNVGQATIKRDLAVLRQSGQPVVTRGSRAGR